MAEGGDEKELNPYSFQNFFKNSTKTPDSPDELKDQEEKVELSNEPDLGVPRKKKTNNLIVLDEEKVTRREENPFSLKQFLKKDLGTKPKNKTRSIFNETNGCIVRSLVNSEDGSSSSSSCSSSGSTSSPKHRGIQGLVTPDFANVLPDFVQDHFFLEHNLHEISPSSHDDGLEVESLPDFTLGMPPPPECLVSYSGEGKPKSVTDSPSKLKLRGGSGLKVSSNDISHFSSSLPDFLSDGPMLSNHIEHSDSIEHEEEMLQTSPSREALQDEIQQLRQENETLKQTIEDLNSSATVQATRITELQREVHVLQNKEVEEMNNLEKMVQQVENNLKTTQQRATIAENMVVKLKQEVKSLQSQLLTLTTENELLKSGDKHTTNMREKAKSASEQITFAVNNAEQTLRQLLNGVESLKLVASYLANIDKVVEEKVNLSNDQT